MNRETPMPDQLIENLIAKHKIYREAVDKGDPIAAAKAKEEIRIFLTEEQNLSMANLPSFDPEIQKIIVEAEAENRKKYHKLNYKELN